MEEDGVQGTVWAREDRAVLQSPLVRFAEAQNHAPIVTAASSALLPGGSST